MPKYVWKTQSGKFAAEVYVKETQSSKYISSHDTIEEAEYVQITTEKDHHWLGMPEVIPESAFGFTYRMTHKETGQQYLGAKQLYFWDGPVGGYKCSDPSDEEFDKELWKESDWKLYTSSSKVINKMINEEPWRFHYEVIELHRNKLDLFYSELKTQIELDVLHATDADGNYVYLNANIMGVEYRPAVPKAALKVVRLASQKAMRDYYLKPTLCEACGSVLPFGETQCPKQPMFGKGDCNEQRASNG